MTVYSQRLGDISDAQFEVAVRQAGLGDFLSASHIKTGLFGQNVFITTSMGEFVFRGAPHGQNGSTEDLWQFRKERFYANHLHAKTDVPVAWPQRLETSGPFDWPYLLMPKLPGLCLDNPASRVGLETADYEDIARTMGAALVRLQSLSYPFAGDFDPATQDLAPFVGGYRSHLAGEFEWMLRLGQESRGIDSEDIKWVEALIAADKREADEGDSVYVHNDFTHGNVLVERTTSGWRVSGVVDLMTSCFGDPAADLVRQSCAYLDRRPSLASIFIGAYRAESAAPKRAPARLALLIAYERLLIWEYFCRPPNRHDFTIGTTFRVWADTYVTRLQALFE